MNVACFNLVLVVGLTVQSSTAVCGASPVRRDIADFGHALRTTDGGLFGCLGGSPGQIRDALVTIGDPPRGAWRIEVDATAPAGVVGVFIALSNPSASSPDLLGFPEQSKAPCFLNIRVLGRLGGRRVGLSLSSSTEAGDAVSLGYLDELVPDRWQVVSLAVPVAVLRRAASGAIRLSFVGEGAAWLAIDRIALSSTAGDLPGDQPVEHAAVNAPHAIHRALWVWNTSVLLESPGGVDELLALCRRWRMTDLFWQVPYTYRDGRVELEHVIAQRRFNASAHRAGITVHALDGGSDYVRRANHPRMLALVDALVRFNGDSPRDARYRAVHLDNEPYVLPEWKNPATRRSLLDDYMTLNRVLSRRVRGAGMAFGVDIPFWWDARDAAGRALFTVQREEGTKPLLEALFALLDNAGVMAYRQRVLGPNGVIAHCEGEFDLGARLGVDVFAAVELGSGDDVEPGTTLGPYGLDYFRAQVDTLQAVLAYRPGCAGYAIHYYSALKAMEN